jgi:D-glycero-alpha-D-manno-heptose-7-phosphate kinase
MAVFAAAPLRVTLGGGGTDLPSYFTMYGGFHVSAAIEIRVGVTMSRGGRYVQFDGPAGVVEATSIDSLDNAILRAALRLHWNGGARIRIRSRCPVPPGTGLGSSGSFAVALVAALLVVQASPCEPRRLAELACVVEAAGQSGPVGKQDPYVATFGGIQSYSYSRTGEVKVRELDIPADAAAELERRLLLFQVGRPRRSAEVLAAQDAGTRSHDLRVAESLHSAREMGKRSAAMLERGDVDGLGRLLTDQWHLKVSRTPSATNPEVDEAIETALAGGADGAKLVGAGAGGYVMVSARDPLAMRRTMRGLGASELPFQFARTGVRTVNTGLRMSGPSRSASHEW